MDLKIWISLIFFQVREDLRGEDVDFRVDALRGADARAASVPGLRQEAELRGEAGLRAVKGDVPGGESDGLANGYSLGTHVGVGLKRTGGGLSFEQDFAFSLSQLVMSKMGLGRESNLTNSI